MSDISTSATDTYKTAIKSVGLSANRRENTNSSSSQAGRNEREAGAFVEENEFIDEDWLIDDLGPASKRQKTNASGAFMTGSSCRSRSQPLKRKSSSVRKESREFENLQSVKDDIILDEDVMRNSDSGENVFIREGVEEDIVEINSDFEDIQSSLPTMHRARTSRNKRQLKLTSYGVKTVNANNSAIQDSHTITDIPSQQCGVMPSQQTSTQPTTPHSVRMPAASVRVRVKDKLLIVPIFEEYVFLISCVLY